MCIVTNSAGIKPEDSLQLEFYLPTGRIIHSKADVRWVNPEGPDSERHRVGLEFKDLTDAMRQDIRCFIGKCRYGCE
jgi:hypothetical protein